MNTTHLIGLVGYAGSGKDTVASILNQFYSFKRHALADKVKQVVEVAFGISTHASNHPQLKGVNDNYWSEKLQMNFSPRAAAQLVGTEAFRGTFGKDIWIQILEREIYSSLHKRVAVSDVRFENEGKWILDNGGILLYLTRPQADGKVGISNHASEDLSWLEKYRKEKLYALTNDASISQLRDKIHLFMKQVYPELYSEMKGNQNV